MKKLWSLLLAILFLVALAGQVLAQESQFPAYVQQQSGTFQAFTNLPVKVEVSDCADVVVQIWTMPDKLDLVIRHGSREATFDMLTMGDFSLGQLYHINAPLTDFVYDDSTHFGATDIDDLGAVVIGRADVVIYSMDTEGHCDTPLVESVSAGGWCSLKAEDAQLKRSGDLIVTFRENPSLMTAQTILLYHDDEANIVIVPDQVVWNKETKRVEFHVRLKLERDAHEANGDRWSWLAQASCPAELLPGQ